jgi:acetyl-CoA acetyltransferase
MALATRACETPASSARFGFGFPSGGEAVVTSQITWNITAGNSSRVNDAAAAAFIRSAEAAYRLGVKRCAKPARLADATVIERL